LSLPQLGTVLGTAVLFLNNVVLGVVGRWSVGDSEHWLSVKPVPTKQTNDLLTFGVGRGSVGARRAFVNVEYISSDELGDLARLG
jgi:hypothetical protein